MNMANFEAWHFSAMFLAVFGLVFTLFYFLNEALERFTSDEEYSYPRLARLGRIAKRCFPKGVKTRVASTIQWTVNFLERTIFTEDVLFDDAPPVSHSEDTYVQKQAMAPSLEPVAVFSSIPTLVTQAGRLIEALDHEIYLSPKQSQQIDSIVDAVLFLNDEFTNKELDASTNSLFTAKLKSMVNELQVMQINLSYTHQRIAN